MRYVRYRTFQLLAHVQRIHNVVSCDSMTMAASFSIHEYPYASSHSNSPTRVKNLRHIGSNSI